MEESAQPAPRSEDRIASDAGDHTSFQDAYAQPLQQEKLAPCQANCPSSANIRGWINHIAQHQNMGITREDAYADAWRMIVEVNPLLASVGRICPHPCQDLCNRSDRDGAVSINAMERFLGDWGLEQGLALPRLDEIGQPERVGVIGAGPAGLSFAYQMARRGYGVTIYEQHERAGGMLRYGIPEYRLPVTVLDAEIQRILDMGVELRTGVSIGRDVHIDALREEYDVLFLGIGAQQGIQLDVPGEEGPGVWTGTDFLQKINTGMSVEIGKRVIVVGGGNTAIDAARAARRMGADVTILYRRTRSEMPAHEKELDDALSEAVHIEYLAAPVAINRVDGRVRSIRVQRMELGAPDASGRSRPVPIPDSEFEIDVDCVITAVSQQPEFDAFGSLPLDGGFLVSDEDGRVADDLWSGGDVRGLGIATLALSQGREAAETIHRRLRGIEPEESRDPEETPITPALLNTDFYAPSEPGPPPRRPTDEWLSDPDTEIDQTITEEQFMAEISRCFSCGLCFGCEHCWMYCNASAFTKLTEVGPGSYFTASLVDCEGCGKCVQVCPSGFLSLKGWED